MTGPLGGSTLLCMRAGAADGLVIELRQTLLANVVSRVKNAIASVFSVPALATAVA